MQRRGKEDAHSAPSVVPSQRKSGSAHLGDFKRLGSSYATFDRFQSLQQARERTKKSMPKMQTAKARKLRKKQLLQRRKDVEEIRMFRGKVRSICTGMDLDVASLQNHIEEILGEVDQQHDEAIEIDPLLSESEPILSNQEERPAISCHYRWEFRTYSDVLHAHLVPGSRESLEKEEYMSEIHDRDSVASWDAGSRNDSKGSQKARSLPASMDTSPFGTPGGSGEWIHKSRQDRAINPLSVEPFDSLCTSAQRTTPELEHNTQRSSDCFIAERQQKVDRGAVVTDLSSKDIFFFQHGCVVFWNFEEDEQNYLLQLTRSFQEFAVEEEEEEMTFFYGLKFRIQEDQICLATSDALEKLAVSFALAQSSTLIVLESRVEETFEKTKKHPQELAEKGSITLSRQEVSQLMGYLCIVKSHVNLQAKMIHLPNFFWDHREWEDAYSATGKYLEVEERVNIVNNQLEVLDSILEVLKDQMEMRMSARSNDYMLGLMMVSVLVEIVYNIALKVSVVILFKEKVFCRVLSELRSLTAHNSGSSISSSVFDIGRQLKRHLAGRFGILQRLGTSLDWFEWFARCVS